MPRFLLPPDQWSAAELAGDEARHLTQVLRLQAGQQVTVFDGKGRRASATIQQAQRNHVSLSLGESTTSSPPLPHITLAQAIPKGKNMELIVQKAVELGVTRIQPLVTCHTVVQPSGRKPDKWRRIAVEACKQCGQDTLPVISEPVGLEDWLQQEAPTGSMSLIASLVPGAMPMRDVLQAHEAPTHCSLLIGPEGDFALDETNAALAAGYQAISLGDIVLRVETASLYCLSALRYEFG